MRLTQTKTVTLPNSDVKVFYREQGGHNSSVLLLLHGFPSSSHQYRDLIPLLANHYHVIAPDLPGFGFTENPLGFKHNFANLATTVGEFLDILSISKFSMYIFDYGAPTGLRLALQRPDAVQAIITQNGNAYKEGLGDVWAPVKDFWASEDTLRDRTKFSSIMLNFDTVKFQYVNGTPDINTIAPESYTLDYALMERPGNKDIQLDLFFDYQNNLTMYEDFQQYFRVSQVPLLAVWGKNDVFFIPSGAEAFHMDLPNARVRMIDAGHFAVESHTETIANEILDFLKDNKL
jgi:pimeloyl-ACP methyl ester carboxylesterase